MRKTKQQLKEEKESQKRSMNFWKWGSVWPPVIAHDTKGELMRCPKCRASLEVHHYGMNGVDIFQVTCRKDETHYEIEYLWREKEYPERRSMSRRDRDHSAYCHRCSRHSKYPRRLKPFRPTEEWLCEKCLEIRKKQHKDDDY